MTQDNIKSKLMSQTDIETAITEGRIDDVRDQFVMKKGYNLAIRETMLMVKDKISTSEYDQIEANLEADEQQVEAGLAILDIFRSLQGLQGDPFKGL